MPESHTQVHRRKPDGTMEHDAPTTIQVTSEQREFEELEDRLRNLLRIRRMRAWTTSERDRILRLLIRAQLRE